MCMIFNVATHVVQVWHLGVVLLWLILIGDSLYATENMYIEAGFISVA